jgi:5-methylphenazine-1-carboxylate 1-monooxygenase
MVDSRMGRNEHLMHDNKVEVAVVGGGIGGLACALMLLARGIKCAVFEEAAQIRELGVGINLLPHATAKLATHGLLDRLYQQAIPTRDLTYMNRFGQSVWHELRGCAAGYDVPQFSIHRGRLQTILLEAVRHHPGAVHTGHKLVRFSQSDQDVTCEFKTADGVVSVTANIVIGADGIHSQTRKILFPNEGPARWNGIIVLRGATDWPQFLSGASMLIAGGMKAKAVIYPIAAGTTPDRRLTNWTINIKLGEDGSVPPVREDWSRRGDPVMLEKYARLFSIPQIDVSALVSSTEEFWQSPMCDQDPLPRWSHGRVTLLGDAAHPMYPTGSNGAGQAILDADCLASLLTKGDDSIDALRAYERQRLSATAEIIRRNRIGGPEYVIDLAEQRAPLGFEDIEAVVPYSERKRISEEYAATAKFALQDVNLN